MADLVTLGFKVDAGEVKAASRELDNLKRSTGEAEKASSRLSSAMSAAKIGLAAAGAAAAAAGAAVAMLAKRGLESVDSQVKLARSLSATTDAVRAVQLAAGEAGLDGMDESLNRLNRRLGAAQMGMATYANSVEALGLNLQTLAGMDADQRIAAIADAVRDSGLSAQETARHLQQLGFEQAQANAFFRAGGDAIREARKAVDDYGLSMSAIDSAVVEQANDAWGRNALVLESIQNRLAVAVAPAMMAVATAFQEGAKEASGFGDLAGKSIDFATRAVAFMADAVDGLRRVFLVAGQGIATFAHSAVALMYSVDDAIINGPVRAVNSLLSLLSKLPGVDFEAIGLTKLGKHVQDQAEEAKRAIMEGVADVKDTLAQPMPSVAILGAIESARTEMVAMAGQQAEFDSAARQNIGSFTELGDAAASAAVKESDLADQFEALRKQLDPAYAATKNYEDSIKTLDQALAKGLITAGEYSSLLDKLNESMKATDEMASDAAESASRLADEFDSLRRRIDPAYAATMDYAEAVDTLNQALMNGLISADEYQQMLEKVEASVKKTANNISDAADPVAEAWKNGLKRIDDSFAAVWKGAFDSFKSFRKSLTDAFYSMLAELAHAAITQPIMISIGAAGGIIPGAASAATGGATGTGGTFSLLSTAKTAYDAVTGGFTAIGTAVGDATNNVGAWVVNNTTGVLNQMGGSLMNASASIGTAASYLSGAAAGAALGSVISGTYAAFGNANIANIGGTIVGSILGGPIGGAIGGAIGGVINRAFGSGPKKVKDYGISGTFSTEGADIQEYQKWKQKGGMFSSSKSGTRHNPVNDELDQYLDAALQSITLSTQAYADILGLNASAIDGVTQTIKVSLEDMNPEEQQAAIEKALAGFGDLLAGQYENPFIRADETAGAAMARLATSLLTVNQVLGTLDQTLLESTLDAGAAASALIDVFGGVDNFAKSTTAYYQAFYSEAERAAIATGQMTDVLASMGLAMPSTREEFRALVEAQDLMTDSGRQTYAALIELAPSFDAISTASEKAAEDTSQAAILVEQSLESVGQSITLTVDEAAQAAELAAINIDSVNQALGTLNQELVAAAPNVSDAAAALLELFDGIDNLNRLTTAYYQAYYSEAERAAIETEKMTSDMAALNLAMPATREEFRALVEAQDLMTDSGRRTYAALMNLAPAFDALMSSTARVAEEAAQAQAIIDQNAAQAQAIINQNAAQAAEAAAIISENTETAVNSLANLNGTLGDSSAAASAAAQDLILLSGGIENLSNGTTEYYQRYYSEAERAAIETNKLMSSMASLNIAMPSTREGFRSLVESQDLMTESGRHAYVALISLAPAFDDITRVTESMAAAAEEDARAVATANHAFAQLGQTLVSSADAANTVAAAFGGMESFLSATTAYYQIFYSESEQSANAAMQLSGAFSALGLAMPETRDEFRALVDAQNLMTAAGREAYATLIMLAPAFDAAATAAEAAAEAAMASAAASAAQQIADEAQAAYENAQAAADSASAAADAAESAAASAQAGVDVAMSTVDAALDAVRRAVDAQIEAVQKEADARVEANRKAIDAAQEGLSELQDELQKIQSARESLSDAFDPNKEASRSRALDTLARAIESGDFTGAGDAAEIAARIDADSYTNSAEYQLEQARTLNLLDQASSLAEDQVSSAEEAITKLEDNTDAIYASADKQIARLEAIYDRAQAQVDAVHGVGAAVGDAKVTINSSLGVLTAAIDAIPVAMQQYQEAASAAAQARASADAQAATAAEAQAAAQAAAQTASQAQSDANTAQANAASASQAATAAGQAADPVYAELSAQQSIRMAEIDANYMALFGHPGDAEGRNYWLGTGLTGDALTNEMRNAGIGMGVTPLFASGGSHNGGLRIVGERGPELEATGPSRIVSNEKLLSAIESNDMLLSEIRALRSENMAAQRAIERNTRDMNRMNKRWDRIGMPETRVLA